MPLALLSFAPHACPQCGADTDLTTAAARAAWFEGDGHTCRACKTRYRYVAEERLEQVVGRRSGRVEMSGGLLPR